MDETDKAGAMAAFGMTARYCSTVLGGLHRFLGRYRTEAMFKEIRSRVGFGIR